MADNAKKYANKFTSHAEKYAKKYANKFTSHAEKYEKKNLM